MRRSVSVKATYEGVIRLPRSFAMISTRPSLYTPTHEYLKAPNTLWLATMQKPSGEGRRRAGSSTGASSSASTACRQRRGGARCAEINAYDRSDLLVRLRVVGVSRSCALCTECKARHQDQQRCTHSARQLSIPHTRSTDCCRDQMWTHLRTACEPSWGRFRLRKDSNSLTQAASEVGELTDALKGLRLHSWVVRLILCRSECTGRRLTDVVSGIDPGVAADPLMPGALKPLLQVALKPRFREVGPS